jgi:hypothetical protein
MGMRSGKASCFCHYFFTQARHHAFHALASLLRNYKRDYKKRKDGVMKPEIVKSLANFLEAMPYQVATWDKKVVDHLAAHPEKLKDFHAGTPTKKWGIYSAIKYQSH